jgi:hypothetical protein
MNQVPPLWVAVVSPVASLLGTMLMVMLGFYLQNRSIEGAISLLRAEIKEQISGLEMRISKELSGTSRRLERIEETRGLIR